MNILIRVKEAFLAPGRRVLAFFRAHATLAVTVFLLVAVLVIVWGRFGFTLEFNRFFAAQGDSECDDGITCTIDRCTNYDRESEMCLACENVDDGTCEPVATTTVTATVTATATATTAAAACNNNGTCDVGESLEAGCEDCDLSQGRYLGAEFTDNYGAAQIVNTTYQDNRKVTYCVFEMINGSFTNQQLIKSRIFTIGAAPPKKTLDVSLADVYTDCGKKTLQLDLIRGEGCGEAPYHHAGFLFDAIIGLQYDKACPTSHLACSGMTCATVQGVGENTCATDPDCWKLSCVNNACAKVAGTGANEGGCIIEGAVCGAVQTHLVCTNNACVKVNGAGNNESGCTIEGATCGTTQTHAECNTARACVQVAGAGTNQCATNADCAVTTQLVCAPQNQTVSAGQTAQVNASGGTGAYGWTAPGSAYMQQDGSRVSVRYDRGGTFPVAVQDREGRSAVCYVNVRVVETTIQPPPTFPALQIVKLVRNVTQGTGEADGVNANSTDTVEFSLRVSSVGSGTATRVIIVDGPPAGLTLVPGTTAVDGAPSRDITPNSDASALVLGDMVPGRTIIVRFRATVSPAEFFPTGTHVLTNTGFARADNTPGVTDTAFVTVTKGVPVVVIPTGPGETTMLALIVASIVTLLYVGYTGTDAFRRRELLGNIDVARRDKDQFNFKK